MQIPELKETNNLEKLRAFTKVPIPELDNITNKIVKYKVEKGACYAMGILSRKEISAAVTSITEDCVFGWHTHNETEWLIIFDGAIKVETETTTQILEIGSSIEITPKEKHNVIAIKEAKVLAVTIPASEEFPSGC